MQKTLYIPIDTTLDNTIECEKLIKRGDTLLLQLKVFTNGALANLVGQSIDLILKKADGTLIQKVITDVSNGTVTAILDLQATNVPGQVLGEIQLTDSNSQISTNTFTFNVDESVANDVIVASKYDIQVLNDLRAAIADIENKITQYSTHVSAISNSIEAIEALENIKAYIEINLQALEYNNAQAVINNKNLITQNNEATSNISTLTIKNAEASNLIKTLESDISTGDNLHSTLQTDIKNGNYVIDQLNTSDWFYILSIAKLYEKNNLVGQELTDENGNMLTDENNTVLTF